MRREKKRPKINYMRSIKTVLSAVRVQFLLFHSCWHNVRKCSQNDIFYLRFWPPSPHSYWSAAGREETNCLRWACSNAFHICSSEYASNGSRFIRSVPENNTGSCQFQTKSRQNRLSDVFHDVNKLINVHVENNRAILKFCTNWTYCKVFYSFVLFKLLQLHKLLCNNY